MRIVALAVVAVISGLAGPAQAQSTRNWTGIFDTTEGQLNLWPFGTSGREFKGEYGGDGGRISARTDRTGTLMGRWTENFSDFRCDEPLNGTYYWGTFYFAWNGAGKVPGFLGEWWYCDGGTGTQGAFWAGKLEEAKG